MAVTYPRCIFPKHDREGLPPDQTQTPAVTTYSYGNTTSPHLDGGTYV
jgi:hypothetical protein